MSLYRKTNRFLVPRKATIYLFALYLSIFFGILNGNCQIKGDPHRLQHELDSINAVNYKDIITLYLPNRRHSGVYFKVGNQFDEQIHRVGRLGKKLRPYIKKCPEAEAELNMFSKANKTSWIFPTVGGAATVIGFSIFEIHLQNFVHPKYPSQYNEHPVGYILAPLYIGMGVGLIAFISGIIIRTKSYPHLVKSVKIYNYSIEKYR